MLKKINKKMNSIQNNNKVKSKYILQLMIKTKSMKIIYKKPTIYDKIKSLKN